MKPQFDRLEAYITALSVPSRFVKFGIAGGAGMIVDNIVLLLLVTRFGHSPTISKLGAAALAILVSFAVNETYTFEPKKRTVTALIKRYLKSNVVRAGGVGVALLVLYTLNTVFGVWYMAANLIGIGVAFFVNYAAESLFTWRVHSQ